MPKKNNTMRNVFAIVILIGLALVFGNSFKPSAFTFEEQQPLVTTQNNLTLKLCQMFQ
jgi:hypothetical protein